MLDRLSLYKPFFDEDAAAAAEAEDEEDDESADRTAAMAYTPPASSLTGSQSPGAYLSDSAATVRASTRVAENGQNGERERDEEDGSKGGRSSPRTRLLEVKRQGILATNGGQYGDSGISLSRLRDEANEQELIAMRIQLDEEVDELIAARLREELQQTLGQPLTEVPIVLCALWRVDGWMWNLTATVSC